MQIDKIILFETPYAGSLYPFSALHCAWELRCGALRLFEKIQKQFPDAAIIYSSHREKHLKSFIKRFEINETKPGRENILVLNSSVLPSSEFWNSIEKAYDGFLSAQKAGKSCSFCVQETPLAVFISKDEVVNPIEFDVEFLPKLLFDYQRLLPQMEIPEPKIINFLWDAIEYNAFSVEEDKRFFRHNYEVYDLPKEGVWALNPENIYLGKDVKIYPGVVLDAEKGAIIIADNVKIMPQATIIGPCFIGDNCTIKTGAKIYEACSFGEQCKVGGEVENSIIQSYSNKQHDGFLGHSYISEWVNLGADTNTSDLKNTYSNINVRIKGERFNTGRMFLGLLCGDHTKSAIMTRFTTGTIAGICGILFSDDFLPSFIPSFCYGGAKNSKTYLLEEALQTAKVVMKRRGKELSDEETVLISEEFEKEKHQFIGDIKVL